MDGCGELNVVVIQLWRLSYRKLVVELRSVFVMSFDEFDKETRSFDGLQPKQADLSCVHALNELHLHEIRVVPSKHEADQYPGDMILLLFDITISLRGIASAGVNSGSYFLGQVTPFFSIIGQMSGPFLTDSRIICDNRGLSRLVKP
ncbi:hypothetical protein Tco_1548520 [Tanacetum coccineum]